jgi:hypothetical protein
LNRIAEPQRPQQVIEVPTRLVVRDSV